MAGSRIPKDWEASGHIVRYDVTDKKQVEELSRLLVMEEEGPKQKASVAGILVDQGLMQVDWYTRMVLRVARWRNRKELNSAEVAIFFFVQFPTLADDLLLGAAKHCYYGKDVDTPDAICGFDQQEADFISTLIGGSRRFIRQHDA